jgi:hypothetical protein
MPFNSAISLCTFCIVVCSAISGFGIPGVATVVGTGCTGAAQAASATGIKTTITRVIRIRASIANPYRQDGQVICEWLAFFSLLFRGHS